MMTLKKENETCEDVEATGRRQLTRTRNAWINGILPTAKAGGDGARGENVDSRKPRAPLALMTA